MGEGGLPEGQQGPKHRGTGGPCCSDDAVAALAASFASHGDLVYDQVAWRLRAAGTAPSPNEIADVVRDTFMVAFAAPFRAVGRLQRAWLLAIARNECLRILDVGGQTQWPATAPLPSSRDMRDGCAVASPTRHPGANLAPAELRGLVRGAAEGLDRRGREILELGLRHGLTPEEVGRVIGLAPQEATRTLAQLGGEFRRVLGTLLLARSGTGSCTRLNDMASRWDGQVSRDRRRRLVRHADHCPVCAREREDRVDAVGVLRLPPLQRAPRAVERWVLADASDGALAVERTALAQRAGPYDSEGFPVPVDRLRPAGRSIRLSGASRPRGLRAGVRG